MRERRVTAVKRFLLLILGIGWIGGGTATFGQTPVAPTTLRGTVTVGTKGIPLPVGLPLKLTVLRGDPSKAKQGPGTPLPADAIQEVYVKETPLPADGNFSFPDVPLLPNDLYVVTAIFAGITQGSAPITFSRPTTPTPLEPLKITLYERTTDKSNIVIAATTQAISFTSPNRITFLESVTVLNKGDRFFLSDQRAPDGTLLSLLFPLPTGAAAIAFNTIPSSRFFVGGTTSAPIIADSKPILPNQPEDIVYSYQTSYKGGAVIDRDYAYPVAGLQITVPTDSEVSISGHPFKATTNNAGDGGRSLAVYTIENPTLKAGGQLVYMITGEPRNPEARGQSRSDLQTLTVGNAVTLIAVLLFIVIAGLLFARWTGQQEARREQHDQKSGSK